MKKILIIFIGTLLLVLLHYILNHFVIKKGEYTLVHNFTGAKIYQTDDLNLSIIDINLDNIAVSFFGVNKDDSVLKKEKYLRFFADDIAFDFEKKEEILALVNGQFFTDVKNNLTALSFPLKSNGKIINSYVDNGIAKRTFVIDKRGNARIIDGYKKEYLENNDYTELIVSFPPSIAARRFDNIGRTYIGLKNSRNIIFFIAKNKTQSEMDNIISNYGVKYNGIIMMDGGPSSQFSVNESYSYGVNFTQFYGNWKVPHFFVVHKK